MATAGSLKYAMTDAWNIYLAAGRVLKRRRLMSCLIVLTVKAV